MSEEKPKLQLKLKTGIEVKKNAGATKTANFKKKKPAPKTLSQKPGMLPPKIFLKIIKHFQTKYPKCFTRPPKPLAIGIFVDMVKECEEIGVSKTQIRRFCGAYCYSKAYKTILVVGAERVDLEGNVKGVVTEKEVNFKTVNKE